MIGRRQAITGLAAAGAGLSFGKVRAMENTGYIVPAEEEPHEMTLMQWPVSRAVHPDLVFLQMLQETLAVAASTIAEFEPVAMLADSAFHPAIRSQVSQAVALWDIPTEDLWARDAGPIVVRNDAGERAVQHIRFNGWGKKQVHRHDGKIAGRVAERLGVSLLPTRLQGEAGGVEQDGHGVLLAHESSWVNDNRNRGLSQNAVEAALLDAYGARRMIWSKGVRDQDITDYHIDSLARFTGPGRVLINLPDKPDMSDPFHLAALETHDVLQSAGLDIEVIPEPQYRRVKSLDFVASYANYYVCNGAVIAPQFGDRETDTIAREALQRHYPGREIVMLNTDPIGEVGGGLHCATHEVPAA